MINQNKVGQTWSDSKAEIVEVFECDKCGFRTTHKPFLCENPQCEDYKR